MRFAVPSCSHVGPSRCRTTTCRYHLANAQGSCVLAHVDRHGPVTLEAVGELLGCTREWVRQIEVGALRKLAARISPEDTESFVDFVREQANKWTNPNDLPGDPSVALRQRQRAARRLPVAAE